jgi:hypothetical protein
MAYSWCLLSRTEAWLYYSYIFLRQIVQASHDAIGCWYSLYRGYGSRFAIRLGRMFTFDIFDTAAFPFRNADKMTHPSTFLLLQMRKLKGCQLGMSRTILPHSTKPEEYLSEEVSA